MSPELVQFLVAGILAAAWIWMLGRPLIATFIRRTRYVDEHLSPSYRAETEESSRPGPAAADESPAEEDAGDEGHESMVVPAVVEEAVETNPLPWLGLGPNESFRFSRVGSALSWLTNWFEQPIERRRLQTMLGFAMANFTSLLFAIALRGVFVQLLILMLACFAVYLAAAGLIGARELRAREAEVWRDEVWEDEVWEDESSWAGRRSEPRSSGTEVVDGMLAEGFFGAGVDSEEISRGREVGPLDHSIFEPDARRDQGSRTAAAEYVAELGLDAHAGSTGRDHDEGRTDGVGPDPDPEAEAESEGSATFVTPTQARPRRNRRPKARPIYIEAEYDEDDGTSKAVND